MTSPLSRPPAPLVDSRGCLTDAGLHVLRSSAAGQAPAEVAAHVAQCARCQERALAVDGPRVPRRGRDLRSAELPSLGRALLLAALVVGAIVVALVTLRRLLE